MLYKKQWHSWFHSQWVQSKERSLQGDIYKHVDTTIIMQFPQKRNKHCWKKMFTQCQNCSLLWLHRFSSSLFMEFNAATDAISEVVKVQNWSLSATMLLHSSVTHNLHMSISCSLIYCKTLVKTAPPDRSPMVRRETQLIKSCTWLFQNLDP
jgi:hypothetical protein